MIRFVLALICISTSLAFVSSDELTNKPDDSSESEGSVTLGTISIEEEAPEASELPKQARDSFNFVSERRPATRPVVRNNIYNFYNYRTPSQQNPQDMTQPGQNNYQPNNYQPNGYQSNGYQSNGYQPNGYQHNGYQPNGYQSNGYQSSYQQPSYNQYYGRPNYQTYPSYNQQLQQQPLQVNPLQPQQQQQQQQQLLQTTDPTQPIGYMLINKYRSPFGTITKPVAFFKTR